MRSFLPFIMLALSAAQAAGGENWTRFRGPEGTGLSDARDLPTVWAENKNVRWKTAVHDKGWSSPVVWGDQIWLTTARADGKQLFALCLDRKTGNIIHDVRLFTVETPQFCHPFNSYASPTPVIEAGRVYVHFGSPGTACLDTASGKVLWDRRDFVCDHFRGAGSSPIIHGDLLFLTFDGFDAQYVAALDKTTGKTVWKSDRKIDYTTTNGDMKKAYATPVVITVDGKDELICPSAEATNAFDPKTGAELWRVTHGGMNEACCPLFSGGLLYLTSGHTRNLLAVRPTGSGNLTRDGIAWRTTKGVPTRPSPLLVNGLLFLVSDDGFASCFDPKDGSRVWQERLGGAFSSSPVFADGKIYAADQDGTTYVMAAAREFKVLAKNKLDAGCMATPAPLGDTLLVRTKTHLYCLGNGSAGSAAK